jgi:hypothetical protein
MSATAPPQRIEVITGVERRRLASFQVCDWLVPLPTDALLGRGRVISIC